MKKWSIILVLFALILSACQSSNANAGGQTTQRIVDELTPAQTSDSSVVQEDNRSVTQENNAVIILERSGGFAGVNEQWSFYADGHITKQDRNNSQASEMFSVDSTQIISLLNELKTTGFFQLKASSNIGGINNCKDCFSYQLTATSDGVTNTISFQDSAGSEMDTIKNITDQLVGLANP